MMIRLLLVDDHPSSRIPLAMVLDREPDMGVVAQAGSLAEAREAIEHLDGEVDLALLDLHLPEGTGTDLIGDLRAANPHALALVLTAFYEQESIVNAVEAGAAGVLDKAANIGEITEAIRRLASGEQLIPPGEVLEMVRVAVRLRERERDAKVALGRLTPRELEILQQLARGLNDKEIAQELHIGRGTVRTHVEHILSKLEVASRLQALVFAARRGAVKIG
jgi:DNA-binding NarL/FixJ family response regulator